MNLEILALLSLHELMKAYNFYNDERSHSVSKIRRLSITARRIAFTRALIAMLFVGMFFIPGIDLPIKIAFAFTLALIFVLLVKKSAAVEQEKSFQNEMKQSCDYELEVLSKKWVKEASLDFQMDIRDHAFAADLDLFGENSVFQMINRSHLDIGKRSLGHQLLFGHQSNLDYPDVHEGIRTLRNHPEYLIQMDAFSRSIHKLGIDLDAFERWSKHKVQFGDARWVKICLWLIPSLSIIATVAYALDVISGMQLLFFYGIPISIVGFHLKRINATYLEMGQNHESFSQFSNWFKVISEMNLLPESVAMPIAKLKDASSSLSNISSIVTAFDNRNNMIAGILLNVFLFWDFRCLWRLASWKEKYGDQTSEWIIALGKLESMRSVATFYFLYETHLSFPERTSVAFKAESLNHPFLMGDGVSNSVDLSEHGVTIITGPNMAGKSTYLRSIGVNYILAMMGAPIACSSAEFRPMKLVSSMRNNDSLTSSESYFFAEIQKLSTIMNVLSQGEEVMVLLDEILKGTNSNDQHIGSVGVIEKLVRLNAHAIIATHDVELCKLEQKYPKGICNQSFEAEVIGDRLIFDYKIKDGVCKKMNASFLMRNLGIIE